VLAQVKEEIAIAVTAGDRLGDGAERLVDLTLVLEALLEHPYLGDGSLVLAR